MRKLHSWHGEIQVHQEPLDVCASFGFVSCFPSISNHALLARLDRNQDTALMPAPQSASSDAQDLASRATSTFVIFGFKTKRSEKRLGCRRSRVLKTRRTCPPNMSMPTPCGGIWGDLVSALVVAGLGAPRSCEPWAAEAGGELHEESLKG